MLVQSESNPRANAIAASFIRIDEKPSNAVADVPLRNRL